MSAVSPSPVISDSAFVGADSSVIRRKRSPPVQGVLPKLLLAAIFIPPVALLSRTGWSLSTVFIGYVHQSSLSPDGTQRARIVVWPGFMDDKVYLKLSGGPASGSKRYLGKFFGQYSDASFRLRWISNHELHISDGDGLFEDWTVVRIVSNVATIDRREVEQKQ